MDITGRRPLTGQAGSAGGPGRDEAPPAPRADAGPAWGPNAGPPARPSRGPLSPLSLIPDGVLVHIAGFVCVRDAAGLLGACRRSLELVGTFFHRRLQDSYAELSRRRRGLRSEFDQLSRIDPPPQGAGQPADPLVRMRAVRAEVKQLLPLRQDVRDDRDAVRGMLQAGNAGHIPPKPASDSDEA